MSAGRIIAIIVGLGISLGLTNVFAVPSYIAFLLGVVGYLAVRYGRDTHQNLSWKLGYGRGKDGRPWSEPWWVDRKVYGLAYLQGKGVELPSTGNDRRQSKADNY
jgi:hypothetical protein